MDIDPVKLVVALHGLQRVLIQPWPTIVARKELYNVAYKLLIIKSIS